jgi:hypothetical protein
MSGTTRSRARDFVAFLFAAVVPSAAVAAGNAPPLPTAAAALLPSVVAIGGGQLTFLGLAVYDGFYWATSPSFSTHAPFALDLHYHREIPGERIATRSLAEIEKLGRGTAEQRRRWLDAMRGVFPDVRPGDRLTGVNVPGTGVRFFRNGVAAGRVDDVEFADAFFSIWLDPKTSRPDFRRSLLGAR